jgi:glycosyltransferase involved in cell wall biosynthesis
MNSSEPAVLYFGNDWFAENRTSSHHVARELAQVRRVIYVECPGLRTPQSSKRDFRKLLWKMWRFITAAATTDGNLTVITLPQIPFRRLGLIRAINHALSRLALRLFMRRFGIRRPITWFVVPHAGHLCGRLGERLSVYYCIDDFAALPGVDAEAVQTMDDDLTCRADVVFVASETLLERKRSLNAATFHSPHGVDVSHFAKASRSDQPVPEEIATLAKPVAGFYGLIERWIDLDLVASLARARPHVSFVMIGRVAVSAGELPKLANLHFLGRRPYESLPDYGRGFDCCLIPYRRTRQVLHANPLKLREYLAMGKPVVSVSTPEVDQFSDVVAVARTHDEFLEKLDQALATASSPADSARRIERVSPMSWKARVEAVWDEVLRSLERRVVR